MPGSAALDDSTVSECAAGDRPTRVLHVINGEHFAGAERVQDLLAAALPQFGFEVGFAVVKPGEFVKRRSYQEAPVYETTMRGRFDLRPARGLVELVRRHDYRLIHTHTVRTALVGRIAAAFSGVPMVHHLHSPTLCDSTHFWRNVFNTVLERVSTCHIAAAIAVSESLGRYGVEHGLPAARVHVVPNGVPGCDDFCERPTPSGTWTIGCVALFRPRKGLETLLYALQLLRTDGVSVRLRAVGTFETPEYEREIHKLVVELGVGDLIEWRGFRRDVAAEFAAMDLFVLPSLFGEGMPMVVLEAMSFGVPVIATRVEGIPEAIRDEQDGLIVEPNDPLSLALAIARFVHGRADWQALRTSARQRQCDRFSARSMAEGVARVYRSVLGLNLNRPQAAASGQGRNPLAAARG